MMICDADFDELFPGRDRREPANMHPIWQTRLVVLMPATAALITASQVLQSMARAAGGTPQPALERYWSNADMTANSASGHAEERHHSASSTAFSAAS